MMDFGRYARAVRRYWWWVAGILVVCIGASLAIAYSLTPKYEATVTFFVSVPDQYDGSPLTADQYARTRIASYAQLLTSDRMGDELARAANVGLTPDQIVSRITPSTSADTVLLTANIQDTSKQRALVLAQNVAAVFPVVINSVDARSARTATVLTVTSGPDVKNAPVSPQKSLIVGLGILVGLVLGLSAVFVRELLDRSIRSARDVAVSTGLTVVGSIGYQRGARRNPVLTSLDRLGPRAEAYRQLRTTLAFPERGPAPTVITVTSSVIGEGKSSTAANLAIVTAEDTPGVLLVDADMRRPRIASYFGISAAPGLSEVLDGSVRLEDALVNAQEGLVVLPSGSIPQNPVELLSGRMDQLLQAARTRFHTIILDTPSLLPVTDGVILARASDAVLIVVRHGRSDREQLRSAVTMLRQVSAPITGAVLSARPGALTDTYAATVSQRPTGGHRASRPATEPRP